MSRKGSVKPKNRVNTLAQDDQKQENTRRGVAMLIMLVLAGYALYNVYVGSQSVLATNTFLLNAKMAQGTITRIEQVSGRAGGNYPVVTFQDDSTKSVTFTHHVGCGRTCPAPNTTITVYYDPANPQIALLDGFLNTWYPSIELFGISFISLLGAGVAFIYTLPRRKDLPK